MIRVQLSEDQYRRAAGYSDRVEGIVRGRFNYTQLITKDRYKIGALGEMALVEVLKRRRIKFEMELRADGFADEYDVIVWRGGVRKNVDVKTAGKPKDELCAMPEAQFQKRRQHDEYVGARLQWDHVELISWATRPEVETWEVKVIKQDGILTRCASMAGMRSIMAFFLDLEELS